VKYLNRQVWQLDDERKNRNPQSILLGLAWSSDDSLPHRQMIAQAKGPSPNKELWGFFFWSDRHLVRVTGEGWGNLQSWGKV